MTLRSDLFDYVTNDGGISALIATRFHWLQLPEQVTYPATRYLVVSRNPNTAHDGDTGLQTVTVQIDVIAENDSDAEAVADAFKSALNGFKSPPLSGFMTNEFDSFEEADNLWRVTQEYLVHRVSTV